MVAAESVDVVVVAGDIYDRAVPSADATAVLDRVVGRLLRAGAQVVLTPGNHDSARRLGTFSGLLSAAGLHVRAATPALDEPVLLADEHGEVAVYGIPYLEPEVARHELGLTGRAEAAARGHEGVLTAAMDRIRADLFLRPGARSVVLAHAFVGGGVPTDSERDICVGGVDLVPAGVFDGVDYVALGHLHRPQTLARGCATAARRWRTPSGRRARKQAWLVELDASGLGEVRAVPLPTPAGSACSPASWPSCWPRRSTPRPRSTSSRRGSPTRSARRTRCGSCASASRTASTWSGRARARRPTGAATRSGSAGAATWRWPRSSSTTSAAPAERRRARAARPCADRRGPGGRRVRAHHLALTAFGPFATRVDVDLDDVGRDGLFLLWGPTGAGKTTLLDAVVFALYGTVPGARGEEKRLRSDHSADDVRTEVELELTLGGERLRVTRRPEQQRPKRRGEGWTTEQARLTLQRWVGETWEPVSTRIDEGSEYLRTRLGLSAEQFCQVVLLPQGDFARFLRAEPEDRGRLLRTLFDVGRFARVEDWLAGERTAARERLDRIRARTGTLVSLVASAADVTVPEEFAPELVGAAAGTPVTAWVRRIRVEASAAAAQATAVADAAGASPGRGRPRSSRRGPRRSATRAGTGPAPS